MILGLVNGAVVAQGGGGEEAEALSGQSDGVTEVADVFVGLTTDIVLIVVVDRSLSSCLCSAFWRSFLMALLREVGFSFLYNL